MLLTVEILGGPSLTPTLVLPSRPCKLDSGLHTYTFFLFGFLSNISFLLKAGNVSVASSVVRVVEFYLPQVVNMYVQHHEVAEVVHPYLVHRCRQSVDFSLQCAWLLEAYSPASPEGLTKKNRSHGIKLKNLIMSGKRKSLMAPPS